MAEKVKFRCPGCSKILAAGSEKAGKKAKCPGCGKILAIPSPKPKAQAAVPPSNSSSANDEQRRARFMDGFSHGPKFDNEMSEGYDLSAGDHSVVLQEKAKLLRANIEIDEKERASYWKAKMGSRFYGFLIDYLIISAPVSLLLFLTGRTGEITNQMSSIAGGSFSADAVSQLASSCALGWLLFAVLWILYQGLLVGFKGATVGKMVTKVMVVDCELHPVGLGRAFARGAAYLLTLFVPILVLVGFSNPGNRMVHDLIAGTQVTRSAH